MSAGQISVPIVFRGPNGAAAGVGAQHSQVRIQFFYVGSLLHILWFPAFAATAKNYGDRYFMGYKFGSVECTSP